MANSDSYILDIIPQIIGIGPDFNDPILNY